MLVRADIRSGLTYSSAINNAPYPAISDWTVRTGIARFDNPRDPP